jgi:FkbM family methyltransferase
MVKGAFGLWFHDGRLIKVRRGPLKGLVWKCSSSQQFWMPLGIYEKETANWLLSQLSEGGVFFDIGANYGYFTLMGGRVVGDKGKVFSFEPIPANSRLIEEMVRLNEFSHVKSVPVAVSDTRGTVEFAVEKNNANSHISSFGLPHASSDVLETVSVQTIPLDEFCEENEVVPGVVKCDVEGAEVAVLSGAKRLLQKKKTKWIISTHSKELEERCREIMAAAGYAVEGLEGFHHELLCVPR